MCVSYLICIVREVDFVEDLGRLMLDGLHFHQMRGILPGSITVTMTTMTKRQHNKRSVQLCCASAKIKSCELSLAFWNKSYTCGLPGEAHVTVSDLKF